MKKYKLIKEYPGCQLLKYKVGDIVTQFEFSGSKWYNKYGEVDKGFCLTQSSVEDYPEFWEEVKEKEYQILVFQTYRGNRPYSFTRLSEKGTYFSDTASASFRETHEGASEKYMLFEYNDDESTAEIHQIKRLSDGEIFTVRDKIKNATIRCFKVSDGELKVFVNPNDNPSIFEVDLGLLEKLKPLFVTEDGVNVFPGDECWYILNRNSFVGGNYIKRKRKCNGRAQEGKYFFYEENADTYLKQGRKILYGVNSDFKKTREEIEERVNKAFSAGNWKWFNSEEEREIYIEENQPRFSMMDMMSFGKYVGKRLDFTNPLQMFYDWVNQPKNK